MQTESGEFWCDFCKDGCCLDHWVICPNCMTRMQTENWQAKRIIEELEEKIRKLEEKIKMKIVINTSYGGFGLSKKAILKYLELCEITPYFYKRDPDASPTKSFYIKITIEEYLNNNKLFNLIILKKDFGDRVLWTREMNADFFSDDDIKRTDPNLIKVIELLGQQANGKFANLKIVEIPNGVDWMIEDHDGDEYVSEKHRTWC